MMSLRLPSCFLLSLVFVLVSSSVSASFLPLIAREPPGILFKDLTDQKKNPRHHQSLTLLAIPEASSGIAETTLWGIRAASATSGYIGFVAYFDRPRGTLNVQLDKDIEIKSSTVDGAGLGLFAKTALHKGTVLGTYPGAVVPLSQNLGKLKEYPACEGYIWRFSDNKAVIDPTNSIGILDAFCRGGNPSMPGSTLIFSTLLKPFFSVSTALCRINEPPRGMDVNVVTSENRSSRQVTFELERDVLAGEEFFIDYGLSYDRTMYKES